MIPDVDAALLVIDVDVAMQVGGGKGGLGDPEAAILRELAEARRPVVLAVNKVDTLKDKTAAAAGARAPGQERARCARSCPISATKGTNVDHLVGELWALLPAGPPLYGPDMLTDRSERFLAGELIREQLFLEPAPGDPLRGRGRDRGVGGARGQGRRGHRRDHRRRARGPARDRPRPRGAMIRERRDARARRDQRAAAAPGAPQASRQGPPRLDDLARRARALRVHGAMSRPPTAAPNDRAAAGRAGRAAQRRQVVAVQPPGRRAAGAGRGRARRHARSPLRRLRLGRRRASASSTPAASIRSATGILAAMRQQTLRALDEADVVVFVVDAREGVTAVDSEVAQAAAQVRQAGAGRRQQGRQRKARARRASEAFALGFADVFPVSASHGRGVSELLDAVVARAARRTAAHRGGWRAAPAAARRDDDERARSGIAFVGKPNVGKSSLVNCLLGEERVLVHDAPGTTRDPIDTPFSFGGREYVLVDTAGMRRRRSIDTRDRARVGGDGARPDRSLRRRRAGDRRARGRHRRGRAPGRRDRGLRPRRAGRAQQEGPRRARATSTPRSQTTREALGVPRATRRCCVTSAVTRAGVTAHRHRGDAHLRRGVEARPDRRAQQAARATSSPTSRRPPARAAATSASTTRPRPASRPPTFFVSTNHAGRHRLRLPPLPDQPAAQGLRLRGHARAPGVPRPRPEEARRLPRRRRRRRQKRYRSARGRGERERVRPEVQRVGQQVGRLEQVVEAEPGGHAPA